MSLIKGDRELEHILSIKQKTLRINLNEHIYGTFAEIGAGQETVRHFFRAGGATNSNKSDCAIHRHHFNCLV